MYLLHISMIDYIPGTQDDMRLVDLCVAALSNWLHAASDLKLLPLPKTVINRVHANILYKSILGSTDTQETVPKNTVCHEL